MRIKFLMASLVFSGLSLALVPGITTAAAEKDKDKPKEKVIKTESGLEYVDQKVGKGEPAKKGDWVTVHYTGWLKDGKKFDSSRDRDKPFRFQLGAKKVIKGWDEGVAGMKVGGQRKLIIPPDLGYGNRDIGCGLIPANSTLIFEVELLKIEKD
jgi:FKBP-type peptidyl-prolyl cis-trans isomerase